MYTQADRVLALLKDRGVPQRKICTELARVCDISYQSAHDWFTGDSKTIVAKNLSAIARERNANLVWLIDGVGHMNGVSRDSPEHAEPRPIPEPNKHYRVAIKSLSDRFNVALTADPSKSKTELAAVCKVSPAAVSGWFSGNTKSLESENLLRAAEYLNVSPIWLSTGAGKMERQAGIHESILALSCVSQIPVLNYTQAGSWASTSSPPSEDYGTILTDTPQLGERPFALMIKGESMLPSFREGDLVIVATGITPLPGDFVVAKTDSDEATFRKYRPRGRNEQGQDVFELAPVNEDYESLRSDRDTIQIVGVMLEHRQYRRA